MSRRRLIAPLAAGLAVAAYAAALRRYGVFDPVDEGLLLVQAGRAAHGQVPYLDFHTGYGPLYFRLQALLAGAGGLAAIRWALVAVHGVAGALLYALARRLTGPGLAAAAVALEVAFFLPVAPARGAPLNAPYPAWYAGLGGIALTLLLAGARPGLVRCALAGVLCGIVAAVKPSSGVLLAGGAVAAIALAGAGRDPAGRAMRTLLALVALSALVLVQPMGALLAAWVLVPPVLALAFLGAARGAPDRDALPRVALLAAGFLAVAAGVFAPVLAALGPARFAREVLLIGAGVAEVYALPLPWPAALAAVAGMLVFAGRNRLALAAGLLAAAALLTDVVAAHAASALAAARLGAEQAFLAAVPVIVWGALARLRRGDDPDLVAPAAVTTVGVLQVYPRADFLHLMPLGVLLLPLALRLWRDGAPRIAAGLVVALPLALAAARFVPTAAVLARVASGRLAEVDLGGSRVVIEAEGAPALRSAARAAADVRALAAGGPVLAFPACGFVLFVAGATPAGPHDYFFPGRPDRAEAAALAARLSADPPRVAVTCSAADTPLAAAWDYYPELVELLTRRYGQRAAYPPYLVLEPR